MIEEHKPAYQDYVLAGLCLRHGEYDVDLTTAKHKVRQHSERYSQRVAVRRKGLGSYYIRSIDLERKLQRRLLLRLNRMAQVGDTRGFANTVQRIKWGQRAAADFVAAIKLALNASSPTSAQYIYETGIKQYPNSAGLQSYTRLFARSRSSKGTSPNNPTLRANREWLKEHRAEFRGQWIALRNGELLASATSLEEVSKIITNRTNVLLTRA